MSTAITMSIPLLVLVLTELLISCGLDNAIINKEIIANLKISKKGYILDLSP